MVPELRLSFSAIEAISALLREYGAAAIGEHEVGGGDLQEFDYVRQIVEIIVGDI